MDGDKTMLNSLKFKLGLALSITMLIAAILIGAIGYWSTLHDVHTLQDDHLRTIAAMVDTGRITTNQINRLNSADLEDPDAHVVIRLIDTASQPNPAGINSQVRFPDGLSEGLQTVRIQQIDWRAFVQSWPAGGKLVVAQLTEVRDEIAWHAGKKTLLRILAIVPLLIILLTLMLNWMLAPLNRLAAELNSRCAEDIRTIPDDGLPSELRPFIFSTNTVLQRIALVLEQQRRFIADAAHELRSPLTALTLQNKNLSLQEQSDEARQKLGEFDRGLKRANDLVDQLLTLARAQLAEVTSTREVSLNKVARIVFEELMPCADQKNIRLEFHQHQVLAPVLSTAAELDWITLLRNLVDNAIRYSSCDGRVDVAIHADESLLVIEVRDNGSGIALEERARVFDPFYRIVGTEKSGSGLGLSIVKSIVTTLHGEITINFSDQALHSGTVVSVKIPHDGRTGSRAEMRSSSKQLPL